MLTTTALVDGLEKGVRSPAIVAAFRQAFGSVLSATLAPRPGPGDNAKHDDGNKQFLYSQLFALPIPLRANVAMLVSTRKEPTYNLGFTAAHEWRYGERYHHPAHLRWGFSIEAKRSFHALAAERVLRNLLNQLPGRDFEILPHRPVTGFNQPGKDPSMWLSFVGRCITLDALRASSRSVEELVELARLDLLSLRAVLSAEPGRITS